MTGPLTVAEVLAARLRGHGVDLLFSQSLPTRLVLAAEDAGIRQVTYRAENAGGTMADGYARIRRCCGFVAAQNGPAATLLVPPLTEAWHASIPVVALVQEVPVAHRGRNAFQEIDHRKLFASCAKWFETLEDGSRAEELLDAAVRAATSGRPGPAVLMLPKDVLGMFATPSGLTAPPTGCDAPMDRPRPDARQIEIACDALLRARRPLIVAGGGAVASDAGDLLADLARETGIAVATTPMGKGVIPDDDPLAVGVIGYYMGPHAMTHGMRDWIREVDVVLLVGTRTNENGTDAWTLFPDDATFLHLDIDPVEIGRNYPVAARLVGDARSGLADLVGRIRSGQARPAPDVRTDATSAIAASRAEFAAMVEKFAYSDVRPLRPETVVVAIDTYSPDDAILVADASYSSIWLGCFVSMSGSHRRMLLPRGLGGLGWGFPLALGAKAGAPERPVVCLTGDGGFGHCWAELETSVRESLPVVVVVLNNAEFGYQKHAEIVQYGRATSAAALGCVDHAALARATGAHGVTVHSRAELEEELSRAIGSPHTVVIDVIIDPSAYPPITGWDTSQHLQKALRH